MKAVNFGAVFCLVLLLTGFQVAGQTTEPAPPTAENQKIVGTTEDDSPAKNRRNEKYRIGFQDTLDIQTNGHPKLSLTVNINTDGTIRMPKIDQPIVAACKTETELAETIATLYKSYLRNPFVNVRVVEQRSQPFAVIGAVEKPGSFNLNRKIRLLELLAFAGGPDVEKAGANIQVARVGNVSGCVESEESDTEGEVTFFRYKIKDVQDGKVNPWMQPGDIVSVSDIEHAFVVGNVKEATKVPLKEPVTLTQAIAYAGGLAPEAKTSRVRVQRQLSGSQAKTETIYDLKDIVSKKIPDPVLEANDIVEVPKDGVKSVRNSILKALSGGLSGIFYGL